MTCHPPGVGQQQVAHLCLSRPVPVRLGRQPGHQVRGRQTLVEVMRSEVARSEPEATYPPLPAEEVWEQHEIAGVAQHVAQLAGTAALLHGVTARVPQL